MSEPLAVGCRVHRRTGRQKHVTGIVEQILPPNLGRWSTKQTERERAVVRWLYTTRDTRSTVATRDLVIKEPKL